MPHKTQGIIIDTKITYDDGGFGFGWNADIAEITDDYIYVKYSSGKYYCVVYKNLTETACSFSNAYKDGGKPFEHTVRKCGRLSYAGCYTMPGVGLTVGVKVIK